MKKQMVVVSGLSVVLLLAGCGGETNDPGPGGQGVSKAAVGAMLYKGKRPFHTAIAPYLII